MTPMMRLYNKKCIEYGVEPDLEKFLAVERYMVAFVRECAAQNKATETQCPLAIVKIDDIFYYLLKIIIPNVHANIVVEDDIILLGYGDYINDNDMEVV